MPNAPKITRGKIDETEWIYLAGFVDGEGSFGIDKTITLTDRKTPRYQAGLIVVNTYLPVLEQFQLLHGGSVRARKNQKPQNWRQTYSWKIGDKKLIPVLEGLMPYLREKKPQAEFLLKFLSEGIWDSGRTGQAQRDDAEVARREDIYMRLKTLKQINHPQRLSGEGS